MTPNADTITAPRTGRAPGKNREIDREVVDRVRTDLKKYLSENPTFLSLPRDKQVEMYREMLSRGIERACRRTDPATAQSRRARGLNTDATDPTRLDELAPLAGDFLAEVNFVDFVRDLITGTYGAIVDSTIEQTDAFVRQFKELSKPLGVIARDHISSLDALAEMAASDPLRFTMSPEGELKDAETGMSVDTSNDEIQRLMYEAQLKLAKEMRFARREVMLAGQQRLVVDKGTIRAALLFNVRGTEAGQAKDRTTDIEQGGGQGGFNLPFFGGFGGGKKNTKITVSSRELVTNTELNAQISGFVEVNFKSDYFKLDNFADLFGDESTKALVAEAEQRQNGAAPPA
ncbi:hypothetical protein [Tranquillimonas alkanivorans]|uniref:Uncharacterized protein n=1 Tax=Tranquillimonas alkanivorans TaxID=441119 RepID=A0A1I5RAG6_9RHOB|nr:hypothetical protein [Tranquillimonas alkanivorans]SFP55528.1 hypothetical protein SAMN04488047_10878 [Tranquillimonas alkanivorans]